MSRNVGGIVVALLISALALLSACAGVNSDSDLDAPSRSVAGATTDYPGVVLVILPNSSGICSGTVVSPRAVLTAAHCLKKAGRYTIQGETEEGAFGAATTVKEALGPGVVDDPNDIAILVFSEDIVPYKSPVIYGIGRSVSTGDSLHLVGYGCNNLDTRLGGGVKRAGKNQVADIDEYLFFLTPIGSSSSTRSILGPANRAASCFGDSGGPALKASGDSYEVVGVTHAGGTTSSSYLSEYIDLPNRSDNLSFLQRVNSSHSLGIGGI